MVYAKGRVSFLVVRYAINVFITFSLTQISMAKMWLTERHRERHWLGKLALHAVTLLLCVAILAITTFEKFAEGGWLTFAITSGLIVLCVLVHRHYGHVQQEIVEVDAFLADIPTAGVAPVVSKVDRTAPVAVLMVSGYGGLGVHALLSIQRLFPGVLQERRVPF